MTYSQVPEIRMWYIWVLFYLRHLPVCSKPIISLLDNCNCFLNGFALYNLFCTFTFCYFFSHSLWYKTILASLLFLEHKKAQFCPRAFALAFLSVTKTFSWLPPSGFCSNVTSLGGGVFSWTTYISEHPFPPLSSDYSLSHVLTYWLMTDDTFIFFLISFKSLFTFFFFFF